MGDFADCVLRERVSRCTIGLVCFVWREDVCTWILHVASSVRRQFVVGTIEGWNG